MGKVIIAIASIVILAAMPARAELWVKETLESTCGGCDAVNSCFIVDKQSECATGGWGGLRHELAEKGITPSSTFVFDVLGNPVGGKMQGVRYDSSMGWDIDFDLEKIADFVDTHFHISGLWRTGQNLSTATIDNALVVSSIYGHEQFRFYGLYLEKSFCEGALIFRIGRIGTGDDFASSSLYASFVSNAINGNPISIPINIYFPCYPVAAWGARIKAKLTKDIYVQSAIYDGDPGAGNDDMYGLDFSMRLKRGIAFAAEAAYVPNTDKDSKGLPGHYKAGIYYNGTVVEDLYADDEGASYAITGRPAKKHVGNYNIYMHADQMIYREAGQKGDQGLVPLVAVTLAPTNRNKFPFFIMAGLIYKGMIPGRDDDMAAFEVVYTRWSRDIAHSEPVDPQKYEMMFEWTYKAMITKWLFVQPDIQYIVNPNGGNNIDDALVVGSRVGIAF
jgi:porin